MCDDFIQTQKPTTLNFILGKTKNGGWLAYKKPFETIFKKKYILLIHHGKKALSIRISSHIDRSISLSIIGNCLKERRAFVPSSFLSKIGPNLYFPIVIKMDTLCT